MFNGRVETRCLHRQALKINLSEINEPRGRLVVNLQQLLLTAAKLAATGLKLVD